MAKRVLCKNLPTPKKPSSLSSSEAHHILRVLRLRNGDLVEALDGNGHRILTRLKVRGEEVFLEHAETQSIDTTLSLHEPLPLPIVLEMAILKGEAMEWVVEKSVELGISTLRPICTDFTVVQIKQKGPEIFQERWQKIADQALKQCGRTYRLDVEKPITLESLLRESSEKNSFTRIWCDENRSQADLYLPAYLNGNSPSEASPRYHLLVGPEGGWSPQERELLTLHKLQRVSLGPLIFRAETAALFGVSVLSAHLRCSPDGAETN